MQLSEAIILAGAFLSGALLFYVSYLLVWPSIVVRRRIVGSVADSASGSVQNAVAGETAESGRVQRAIDTFYQSLQSRKVNSISRRLVRAGFFDPRAIYFYYAVRAGCAAVVFVGLLLVIPRLVPSVSFTIVFYVAAVAAFLALIAPNFVLDRMGRRQEERYRRTFPDFMDMLIVCADAGLSLEAAVTRVAKEFLETNREFGIHLNIMMLEVRAGKRLREALQGFADRLEIEEGRSLATVFKQSEELGASLIQTLRVFSNEMRRNRIIRAEEKANSLPVRMVLPLGVFIFPVMLVVVLLPVLLSLLKMLGGNAPV
jgi:tight adherence protein C